MTSGPWARIANVLRTKLRHRGNLRFDEVEAKKCHLKRSNPNLSKVSQPLNFLDSAARCACRVMYASIYLSSFSQEQKDLVGIQLKINHVPAPFSLPLASTLPPNHNMSLQFYDIAFQCTPHVRCSFTARRNTATRKLYLLKYQTSGLLITSPDPHLLRRASCTPLPRCAHLHAEQYQPNHPYHHVPAILRP